MYSVPEYGPGADRTRTLRSAASKRAHFSSDLSRDGSARPLVARHRQRTRASRCLACGARDAARQLACTYAEIFACAVRGHTRSHAAGSAVDHFLRTPAEKKREPSVLFHDV